MKKFNLVSLSLLAITIGASFTVNKKVEPVSAYFKPTSHYAVSTNISSYYTGLDTSKSGTSFLSDLRSFNLSKRKTTTGYSSGGNSATNSTFIYTDYDASDPSKLFQDENGQVYGTVISSFYTYTKTTSFNKEHVWPNTHGGNLVENDIHMARPTISSENSSRSHSYYVEGASEDDGKKALGFDPEVVGYDPNSKGESARIIFYCMTANSNLILEEGHQNSSDTKNKKMGDLDDLLMWNLKYPVTDREKRRNNGGEYLQGNRNAFIDHPEYACKIWGNLSDKTRAICKGQVTPDPKTLSSISYTGSLEKSQYVQNEMFDPTGIVVKATYSDGSTQDVTTSVQWTANTSSVGQVSVTGTYSYEGVTKSIQISITVIKEETPPIDRELCGLYYTGTCKTSYKVGEKFNPTGLTVIALFTDGMKFDVTSEVVWTADTSKAKKIMAIGKYTCDNLFEWVEVEITIEEDKPSVNPGDIAKMLGCSGSVGTSTFIVSISSILGSALLIKKKKRKL